MSNLLKIDSFPRSQIQDVMLERNLRQSEKLKDSTATNIKSLGSSLDAKAAQDRAVKAATDFEALMIQQMLSAMWQAIPKDGLLSGGNEEEIYRDMLNQQIASDMAKHQSIGLKDMVLKEFKSQEK